MPTIEELERATQRKFIDHWAIMSHNNMNHPRAIDRSCHWL